MSDEVGGSIFVGRHRDATMLTLIQSIANSSACSSTITEMVVNRSSALTGRSDRHYMQINVKLQKCKSEIKIGYEVSGGHMRHI